MSDYSTNREGGELVGLGAVAKVDHLDGEKCHLVVNNDGDGCGACPDKASHFVCGTEEGTACPEPFAGVRY